MTPGGLGKKIRDFKAFPLLVAVWGIACVACAGMAIRDAESDLGVKLHPREMTFDVRASGKAVDPRVADAVSAAIEQAVGSGKGYSSEASQASALEPLAYAVAVQTGAAPRLRSQCEGAFSCCTLLCRVMRTGSNAVMVETRHDFERAFHVDPFNSESSVDPTLRCAKGSLSWRLSCLIGLVAAEPSSVKLGPFLVSGRIISAQAKLFEYQAQIAKVQAAIEEQVSREAKEQMVQRERLCNAQIDDAGAAARKSRGNVASVHSIWENAKMSCGDLWSPVHQQQMEKMIREESEQAPIACPEGAVRKVEVRIVRRIVSPSEETEEWCETETGKKQGRFRTVIRVRDVQYTEITEGFFKDGLRDGPWTQWKDGQKVGDGFYKDGLRDGPWVEWRLGKKSAEGTYRRDKEDGHWTFWRWDENEKGVEMEEREYRNGRKVGLWKKWRLPGSEETAEIADYGSGDPYARPCTPKAMTWDDLRRETGAPTLQTVGNPWLDCHSLGSGNSIAVRCTRRTAPVVGTWCRFVQGTLCDADEGRWRNPDDCAVEDVELAKLDEAYCPAFIAKNSRTKGAKPALRVQGHPTCAVVPRSPPGCRKAYDPLAHTYLLHCDSTGGR